MSTRKIKVMSANVKAGGVGRDRKEASRFDKQLALLAAEKPDVLGIQEGLFYDDTERLGLIQQRLEMSYAYVARGSSDMRTAVFVRDPYKIVYGPHPNDAPLTIDHLWRHAAVRVIVETPEGVRITFGSAHMSVGSPSARLLEAESLTTFFNAGEEGDGTLACIMIDTNTADGDTLIPISARRTSSLLCYRQSNRPDRRALEHLVWCGWRDLAARSDTTMLPTTVGKYPAIRCDAQWATEAYTARVGKLTLVDPCGTSDHRWLTHTLTI